ncbi:uncharacterized protein EI90DRAFT_3120235 [Cantharellus anzutake]|uniref:uncharacterized protein n=1 Tax=Cantharellus anzutake TaxID=1750568 RepID=UPI001905363A|nr:uncharacterized protein EI90DRAFT_3120235 [Cantharellus anzutake]KAF8335979.1 hypothetical protein EI90DRAFT_3120235 [Cantharellus anzutake]
MPSVEVDADKIEGLKTHGIPPANISTTASNSSEASSSTMDTGLTSPAPLRTSSPSPPSGQFAVGKAQVQLPHDVLHTIISHCISHPLTLKSLNLVSHDLHRASNVFLWRSVVLVTGLWRGLIKNASKMDILLASKAKWIKTLSIVISYADEIPDTHLYGDSNTNNIRIGSGEGDTNTHPSPPTYSIHQSCISLPHSATLNLSATEPSSLPHSLLRKLIQLLHAAQNLASLSLYPWSLRSALHTSLNAHALSFPFSLRELSSFAPSLTDLHPFIDAQPGITKWTVKNVPSGWRIGDPMFDTDGSEAEDGSIRAASSPLSSMMLPVTTTSSDEETVGSAMGGRGDGGSNDNMGSPGRMSRKRQVGSKRNWALPEGLLPNLRSVCAAPTVVAGIIQGRPVKEVDLRTHDTGAGNTMDGYAWEDDREEDWDETLCGSVGDRNAGRTMMGGSRIEGKMARPKLWGERVRVLRTSLGGEMHGDRDSQFPLSLSESLNQGDSFIGPTSGIQLGTTSNLPLDPLRFLTRIFPNTTHLEINSQTSVPLALTPTKSHSLFLGNMFNTQALGPAYPQNFNQGSATPAEATERSIRFACRNLARTLSQFRFLEKTIWWDLTASEPTPVGHTNSSTSPIFGLGPGMLTNRPDEKTGGYWILVEECRRFCPSLKCFVLNGVKIDF